jgi:hypothetical protein
VVQAGDQVESESEQPLPYDFAKLRKPFQRLLLRGPVIAAYEAGCMGFELARFLEDLQVPCVVAAPGKNREDYRPSHQTDAIYTFT